MDKIVRPEDDNDDAMLIDDVDDEEMEEQQTLPILPDEIWLKIFEELSSDKKELLNAALVCKKWNDIISNSSTFLKNLRCKIRVGKQSDVDEIDKGRFEITRKYRELKINIETIKMCREFRENTFKTGATYVRKDLASEETYTKFLDTIKVSIADTLISLELEGHFITRMRLVDLVELLSGCHVIENLILRGLKLDENASENLKLVKINRLKNLELISTAVNFLDFIECKSLEKILLNDTYPSDHVTKFLNRLEQLDELHIYEFNWWDEYEILLNPKYHWNKLDLSGYEYESNVPDPSSTYFASGIATLEALGRGSGEKAKISFCNFDTFDPPMMQPVLNNCDNIEQLAFMCTTSFPSDTSQLRQMHEIKKLNLHLLLEYGLEYDEQRRNFREIMYKIPNVKHLVLRGDSAEFLENEHNPIIFHNVTLLEVSFKVLVQIQTYSFPSLTTLEVDVDGETRRTLNGENLKVLGKFGLVNLNLKNLEFRVDDLDSAEEADLLMYSLYNNTSHTSIENFKLINLACTQKKVWGHECDSSCMRIQMLKKTRDEFEIKLFGKVLLEHQRTRWT